MGKSKIRGIRVDDELWAKVGELAQELGTNASALAVDYYVALTASQGKKRVVRPTPGEDRIVVDNDIWFKMRPAIAKAAAVAATKAVSEVLRAMGNPLSPAAVAKTDNAVILAPPAPPRRGRPRRAVSVGKDAGPPLTPSNCDHRPERLRKLEYGTWCLCGKKVA